MGEARRRADDQGAAMKPDLPQLQMEAIEELYGQSPDSSSRGLGRSARRVIRTVVVIGSVLVAWEVLARLSLVSQVFFPPPSAIWEALFDILRTGFYGSTLLENLLDSVGRVAVGFVAAVVIGIPLGLAMARSDTIYDIVDPILEFIRPVPPLAYIPLLVVWFGIGELPKVILIAVGTLPMVVFSAVAGVRSTPIQRVSVARCFGASEWQVFWHVYLQSSLPEIFTGLRVGVGIAWSSLVAAELIAAQAGLGWMIEIAGRELQVAYIFIGIVLIGALGYLMDLCVRAIEHFVVPWRAHSGL
jgi:NitT/TauT family transport system permease protein/taurine transport system permease protein